MSATIKYYCSCLSNTVVPPAPHLPSSSHSFHTLPELYFCEECDAVRCNECVSIEVSGYYCPNCLFEVPSASVRAEKNRCVVLQSFYDMFCSNAFVDVLGTASFALSASIRSQSFHLTRLTGRVFTKQIRRANLHFCFIATIVDGTLLKQA